MSSPLPPPPPPSPVPDQPQGHAAPPPPPPPTPPGPSFPTSYGYEPAPVGKPPRPRAKVGGALLLVAAVLIVLGCFLPWVTSGAGDLNGFDNYYCDDTLECVGTTYSGGRDVRDDSTALESPAILAVLGAVVLGAFAITLMLAGRILAIAIIALVAASLGVLVSLMFVAVAGGTQYVDTPTVEASGIGLGVILQFVGAALAVAASIVTLVQRRRPAF